MARVLRSTSTPHTTRRTRLRVTLFALAALLIPTTSTSCKTADGQPTPFSNWVNSVRDDVAGVVRPVAEFTYDVGRAVAPVSIPVSSILCSVGLAGVAAADAIRWRKRSQRQRAEFGWDGIERRKLDQGPRTGTERRVSIKPTRNKWPSGNARAGAAGGGSPVAAAA